MDRTLVVVTCDADRWAFEMLCLSIKKFLQPSKILIIVNEDEPINWLKWYTLTVKNLLKKHYVDVKVKWQFWKPYHETQIIDYGGWVGQQVLKLYAGKYITTREYVVFDSKNFFIKHINLNEVCQVYSLSIDWWADEYYKNAVDRYCEHFQLPITHKNAVLTQNTTPYIMNTALALECVNSFGGVNKCLEYIAKTALQPKTGASEFFLYELFTIKKNKSNKGECVANSVGFWEHTILIEKRDIYGIIKAYKEEFERREVIASGFHRRLYDLMSFNEIKIFLTETDLMDILPSITPSPWKV